MRNVRESVALDAAYLNRSVPAMIGLLAEQAQREVENGRNADNGNASGETDAPVVRGETGGEDDAGGVDGTEP